MKLKNNKIIVILSHCDTKKKKDILINNISKLKNNFNYDILLTSHIPLPENIINQVDFFVFDKSNPILKWPTRAFNHWYELDTEEGKIKLIYFVDDYGWTPFNQIKKGINTVIDLNYKEFIFLNYDLNINNEIIDEINKKTETAFYSVKDRYNYTSFPSLIFFKIDYSNIKLFEKLINLNHYLKSSHAEQMLEKISETINYRKSDIITEDNIDFSEGTNGKLFNNSNNELFSVFFGYDSPHNKDLKKYFFYEVKEDLICKINNDEILIKKNTTKLINTNELLTIKINDIETPLEFKIDKIQIIEINNNEK